MLRKISYFFLFIQAKVLTFFILHVAAHLGLTASTLTFRTFGYILQLFTFFLYIFYLWLYLAFFSSVIFTYSLFLFYLVQILLLYWFLALGKTAKEKEVIWRIALNFVIPIGLIILYRTTGHNNLWHHFNHLINNIQYPWSFYRRIADEDEEFPDEGGRPTELSHWYEKRYGFYWHAGINRPKRSPKRKGARLVRKREEWYDDDLEDRERWNIPFKPFETGYHLDKVDKLPHFWRLEERPKPFDVPDPENSKRVIPVDPLGFRKNVPDDARWRLHRSRSKWFYLFYRHDIREDFNERISTKRIFDTYLNSDTLFRPDFALAKFPRRKRHKPFYRNFYFPYYEGHFVQHQYWPYEGFNYLQEIIWLKYPYDPIPNILADWEDDGLWEKIGFMKPLANPFNAWFEWLGAYDDYRLALELHAMYTFYNFIFVPFGFRPIRSTLPKKPPLVERGFISPFYTLSESFTNVYELPLFPKRTANFLNWLFEGGARPRVWRRNVLKPKFPKEGTLVSGPAEDLFTRQYALMIQKHFGHKYPKHNKTKTGMSGGSNSSLESMRRKPDNDSAPVLVQAAPHSFEEMKTRDNKQK